MGFAKPQSLRVEGKVRCWERQEAARVERIEQGSARHVMVP